MKILLLCPLSEMGLEVTIPIIIVIIHRNVKRGGNQKDNNVKASKNLTSFDFFRVVQYLLNE